MFPLGHPRPPKCVPNWMLIFVVMGDQVKDDMALKFLIFTLGKILQNFFSKIDGNSRASPQCEKSKKFFYNYFLGIKHLCHCANTTIVAFQMAVVIVIVIVILIRYKVIIRMQLPLLSIKVNR